MNFKQTQLNNGLTIIAEINPAAASMAAGFFVQTGSRDETPEVSGVSHFLEHMVFKGTDRRTAFEVNRDFDDIGAAYNAFTSEESTVFYGSVLPEYQDKLLDLICDILRPTLRDEDFNMEKKVILEEIAVYDDQPRFRVYDNLMSLFFKDHPLGNAILGTPESITDLPLDGMQGYFDARYSPKNLTLTAVGNLDYDKLVDSASKFCNSWSGPGAARATPTPAMPGSQKVICDPKLIRQHMGLMSAGPSAQSAQRYAAQVLATIIGDDTGSRFYYALVEPGLADEAGSSFNSMDHAGMMLSFISCDPQNTSKVLDIANSVLTTFCSQGPTESEMTAAKNKIASATTIRGELPMGRLTSVGFDWVYAGLHIPLSEHIEKLLAVTPAEVLEVANQFQLASPSSLILGPVEKI